MRHVTHFLLPFATLGKRQRGANLTKNKAINTTYSKKKGDREIFLWYLLLGLISTLEDIKELVLYGFPWLFRDICCGKESF